MGARLKDLETYFEYLDEKRQTLLSQLQEREAGELELVGTLNDFKCGLTRRARVST
jgi:hypothetical protein